MAEAKWVNVAYFVLLSLLVFSSAQPELTQKETYKEDPNSPVDFHGDGEGKWSWDGTGGFGIGGGIAGAGAAAGGSASGSIAGGISGFPGFGIGSGVNGGISAGGSIVVPGLGSGISGGISVGAGGVIASGTAARPCHEGGDCGGGFLVPEWLGQPLYCIPSNCQQENGGACGGIGLSLDFGSTNNKDNSNTEDSNNHESEQGNKGAHESNGQDAGNNDHHQEQAPEASPVPPKSV